MSDVLSELVDPALTWPESMLLCVFLASAAAVIVAMIVNNS